MARTNGDAESLPCEFSPAGGIFAVATTDGLLKTFDTGAFSAPPAFQKTL